MDIKEIITLCSTVHKRAVKQTLSLYTPTVNRIINTESKDENEIQHTLDTLLDIAFDDDILLLYRKLCRYYYDVNPEDTAYYVITYRDMWNEDSIEIHIDN